MVGISAVRGTSVSPTAASGSADYALTLIQAGGNPDGELVKLLEELKDAAAHNKEVYEQASEAVNDLSALQAEVTRQRAEANDAIGEAESKARENATAKAAAETEQKLAERKMADERKAFENEARDRRHKMDEKARTLADKSTALERQAAEQSTLGAQLTRREGVVEEREAALGVLLGDLGRLLQRVAEIENA